MRMAFHDNRTCDEAKDNNWNEAVILLVKLN